MPVRLSPHESRLICYDYESGQWVGIEGISFSILNQLVEIVPGTTMGHVFDIVEQDKRLKAFLADYCSVNIDEIHQRSRTPGEPILVGTAFEKVEGGWNVTEMSPADSIAVSPFFYVYTDEVTDERVFEGAYILIACSSKALDCGTSCSNEWKARFGTICNLELRLNTLMHVENADDKAESPFALVANVRYTLLDVLVAIYELFGNPVFDRRTQREVDIDEEIFGRFRKRKDDKETEGDGPKDK